MNYFEKQENQMIEAEVAGGQSGQEALSETGELAQLREKYRTTNGKAYEVVTSFNEDDDVEKEYDFIFKRPNTASYDRYVKTSSTSGSRALKTFILDNICDEQYDDLKEALEDYPAMAIGIGEKLLNMLGLSKETQVKKL